MAAFVILSGCSSERTDRGDIDAPTIVSLNPCLDAILVDVADPAQILALSHYSRDPSSSSIEQGVARRFDVTGGTVEEILALEPDIVLASAFIAPATRNALERLGLRVETFGSPISVAESLEQVRDLAALTGNEDAGARLAAKIEQSLETTSNSRVISTLMWQPGQIVPGETTLIGELLRESGFASHSAARGLQQGDYVALETLLANPPELVLVAGNSTGQRHPMLSRLETTHVETLDTNLLYCGGPTIIKVRERLDAVRAGLAEDAAS